jgi:hypothetical protein
MALGTGKTAALLLAAATLAAGCSGGEGMSPGRLLPDGDDDRADKRTTKTPETARPRQLNAFLRRRARVNNACRSERRRLTSRRADLRVLEAAAGRARVQRALSRLLRVARRLSRRLAELEPPPGDLSLRTRAYLDARRELESALQVYRDAVQIGEVDVYIELERERSRMASRARRLAARAGLRACASI